MELVSENSVRTLSLDDLGLSNLAEAEKATPEGPQPFDESELDEDDEVLIAVRRAHEMGYAGVILSGPPGTGKSWYAQQVGVALSGSWDAIRSVQFHPSYQYEDFIFGYAPRKEGGFELRPKEFALICRDAATNPGTLHVLIIDEISRSDVVRVFGEALTYIERDKREQPFQLASGEELSVPKNLIIIGTMNPWDKGVDELDMALERRFAQVDLEPNAKTLRKLLTERGVSLAFVERVVGFFEKLQEQQLEAVRLGHAYFLRCTDEDAAQAAWRLRLRPTLRRACRLEPTLFKTIEGFWSEVMKSDEKIPEENAGDGDSAAPDQG
jgi:5-methylcytosine-specific restriction protein B